MNGKVHVAIGVASLASFCAMYPKGFTFNDTLILPEIGLVSAAFGSYLPDIDNPRTHMGAKHKTVAKVLNKTTGHRGWTHSLIVPAILAIVIWMIPNYIHSVPMLATVLMSILFGVEYGYLLHIFADLFNGKGCPLFMPISKSHISLMDLPSTGVVPWIFAIVLSGVQAAFVLHSGGLF